MLVSSNCDDNDWLTPLIMSFATGEIKKIGTGDVFKFLFLQISPKFLVKQVKSPNYADCVISPINLSIKIVLKRPPHFRDLVSSENKE